MKTSPVTVTDADGRGHPAKLLTCDKCGANRFYIFEITGQNHPHYQCEDCGTSYCPHGGCGVDTSEAVGHG